MAIVQYFSGNYFRPDADVVSSATSWGAVSQIAPSVFKTYDPGQHGRHFTFSGPNLTYSGGVFSGTVTSIEVADEYIFSFSGITGSQWTEVTVSVLSAISLPAAPLIDYIKSGNSAALTDLLYGEGVLFHGSSYSSSGAFAGDIFRGGNGNDIFLGNAGHDQLIGYAGDDSFWGGDGNDGMLAGEGLDLVFREAGNDSAWGGAGNDILLMGDGDDFAYGEGGDDLIFGEAGNDVLLGNEGADFLATGGGFNFAYGGAANDYLLGEGGNDVLSGDDGDDVVVGNAGDDVLIGGAGSDGLFAGAGSDYLIGGSGNDYFYMHTDGAVAGELDIIGDFDPAIDYIVLTAAVADATQVFEANGYTWIWTTVGGSAHSIAVTGGTAQQVQDHIVYA